MLRRGDPDGSMTAALSPAVFSTHLRSETYLALLAVPPGVAPDLEAVREKLAARLLRAPDWAAEYVGRPAGHLALSYADRLAATPVTEPQAKTAVAALIRETGQDVGASAGAAPRQPRQPLQDRLVGPRTSLALQSTVVQRPDSSTAGIAPRI